MTSRVQSGYIQIKRKRFWVIRFAEIYSDNKLYYYYNRGDANPRGIFDLEQSTIQEKKYENGGNTENIIVINTGNSVIKLMADCEKDHQAWLTALRSRANNNAFGNSQDNKGKQIQKQGANKQGVSFRNSEDFLKQSSFDMGSVHDYEQNGNTQLQKPFVQDKQVVQQRFSGDDQLMLKANASFFISEYKDVVLTKVEEGMKIYMCKMGKLKEQKIQDQKTKSPKKEIREYVCIQLQSVKQAIGIPLFCMTFVTVFLLLFAIFYMMFEIFNTSSLILSFLACMNVFVLPYIFLQSKKKQKQRENHVFRYKINMNFPHNLNHFLFAIQQLEDRSKWHPNTRKQTVQKETVLLQLTDFDTLTNEVFQITIYSEQKFYYIVEHQRSHILRIFQLNCQDCKYSNFELNYYSKVSGPQYNEIAPLNSEILLKGLQQYIYDQKMNPNSSLCQYMQKQIKSEQDTLDLQERSITLHRQNILQFQDKSKETSKYRYTQNLIEKEDYLDIKNPENLESQNISQITQSKGNNKEDSSKTQSIKEEKKEDKEEEEEKQENGDVDSIPQVEPENQKYVDMVYDCADQLLKKTTLQPENKWEVSDSKDTWKMHMKEEGGNACVRSEETFNCSAEQLIEYISDLSKKSTYDEIHKTSETLKQITPKIKIVRNELKGVLLVAGRDFVLVNGTVYKGNTTVLVAKSVNELDEQYPPPKKIVRGEILIAGWIIEKIDEKKCKGTFMAVSDPKGGVPQSVKKIGCSKSGKGVKKLKEIMNKLSK